MSARLSWLLGALMTPLLTSCLDRPVGAESPWITSYVQERVAQTAVSKIDLLFMVDNSSSMGDKQEVLAEAVPDLLDNLIHPRCVTCADPDRPHQNDHGHLLQREADGGSPASVSAPDSSKSGAPGTSFLTGNGQGESDALTSRFTRLVQGTGEDGCGFEQQMESVYRFLSDPDPYDHLQIEQLDGREITTLVGTDQALLEQRKAFLRPDSLVLIVALSDENDNSVQAGGSNFLLYTSKDGGGSPIA